MGTDDSWDPASVRDRRTVSLSVPGRNSELRHHGYDSELAIKIAETALERADEAMLWMHTLPHPNGGYPPIPDWTKNRKRSSLDG